MTYVKDVAALARKDLLLELRAKETLPSMLLFVLATLTIFHFALPRGTGDEASLGLLWSALIFTALLGLTRAFVAEREQGLFDALVLAPCDRSAIWLGKTLAVLAFLVAAELVALPTNASADASLGLLWVAILFTALLGLGRSFVAEREQGVLDGLVLAPSDRSAIWVGKVVATLAFLVVAEVVALPAFALFFTSIDASTIAGVALADVGICAVGTVLAAMAAAGRARELLLPLLFLPLAIPIVVGGVGSSLADSSGKYLAFLALYDAIFVLVAWAAFEYVVTE